jgi:type IV pilus assembly protein PilP
MSIRRTIIVVLLILLLSACADNKSDLYAYIHKVKTRPSRPVEPIPQFSALPKFQFPEHDNRRSPFKPVDLKKRVGEFEPDQKRVKQALEAYPLDALKFVGTLKQQNQTWALILKPDKQIVRIRVGDYIGPDYGKVLFITGDTIKIEETIKNSGVWEKRMTTLNLHTGK